MTLNSHDWWENSQPHLDAAHHVYLVLHHTAGPASQTVQDIDDEHKAQGWAGVGYHRLVYVDGTLHEGRPDDVMGAQAKGLNAKSIGVAVMGDFTAHLPGAAQWAGLVHCLAVEAKRWAIPVTRIIGHRDVSTLVGDPTVATACPGDALYSALSRLRHEVAAEMARLSP
jgi:hypothetical protein